MEKTEARSQESGVGSQKTKAVALRRAFPRHIEVHCECILAGLVTLVAFLLAPGRASAASIEGTVFDPSGRAVAGAQVTLLRSMAVVGLRQTDQQGKYVFDELPAGAYRLAAHAPSFNAALQDVQVAGGETRRVDMRLELSAVQQQVVVSASLGGALAPQVGSSVAVISRQEIADRGAQSVLDVLRGVPGVEVNQTGRRGGVTGVFVRGGNSNYNAVMVDGIPLNQFGGDFDFASLPADGVDRVEVVRGPESALYGSNAVTSVINIVSERGEGTPHFTLQGEGGNFTTRRFVAGGSGLTRGVSWGFNVSRLDTGGTVPNDNFRNQTAMVSLGYSRSPRRQVNFHFFGNANNAGAPGPYGSDPDYLFAGVDRVSRDKQNLFGYEGSYAEQISSRFRQVVTASVATNDYYFRSPYGDSYSNNLRAGVNTRSEVSVSNRDFLVGGFEYGREQIRNTYIADAHFQPFLLPRTSLAYFVENRWSPTSRLFVIAGLRFDDIRTHALPTDGGLRPPLPASSVNKLNPRVSAAYLIHESDDGSWLGATRLHGSLGTGIRAANGFELAFTNNPRILPERSLSFDGGFEQRFLENRAVLDLTYYYNRFEDQIVVLGGSLTNLSTFVSGNLGNARANGLELSFRAQPTRSLHLSAEYTLLDTSILALNGSFLVATPFYVGQQLLRRPRHSAAYNVTWQRGRWMLNTSAYFRGATLDLEPNLGVYACTGLGLPCLFTNPGYFLADGGFSYRLGRGVEIYGRLNNLLDRRYEESFGFPALPLNFLAGVKFTFPSE